MRRVPGPMGAIPDSYGSSLTSRFFLRSQKFPQANCNRGNQSCHCNHHSNGNVLKQHRHLKVKLERLVCNFHAGGKVYHKYFSGARNCGAFHKSNLPIQRMKKTLNTKGRTGKMLLYSFVHLRSSTLEKALVLNQWIGADLFKKNEYAQGVHAAHILRFFGYFMPNI